MKKIFVNLSVAFAFAATFTACSNEVEEASAPLVPLQIETEIESTRAGMDATQFENGDAIGLFVSRDGKYVESNLKASTANNGKAWTMSKEVLLDDSWAMVYAYYPWQEATEGTYINMDIASQTNYLYGSAEVNRRNPVASMYFRHALCKLGFLINNNENLKISNVSINGKNLATKAMYEVTAGKFDIQSYGTIVSKNVTQTNDSQVNAYFLVAPSSAQEVTLELDYEGKSYSGKFTLPSISQNQNIYYTVTIRKDEPLEITKSSISDWNSQQTLGGVIADKK